MRLWILCCVAAAMAAQAQPTDDNPEEVPFYIDFYSGKDGFRYEYQQDDGTKADATGKLTNGYLAITGKYTYTVGNVTYTVRYVADEKGYRPTIEESPSEEAPPGVSGPLLASLLGSG